MPFQVTPGGVEVVIKCAQNNIPVVNVMHVDAVGTVTLGDLDAIAGIFAGWIDTNFMAEAHESLVFQQLVVTDISVEDGQQVIVNGDGTVNGALTGDAAAANAAVVVSLRTNRTGRSYRGRFYMGGLAVSGFANAQNVETGYAAGIGNQITALIDLLADGGYKLAVLSRWLNKALRLVGVLTEIVSIVTDTKVDSQRRRTAN